MNLFQRRIYSAVACLALFLNLLSPVVVLADDSTPASSDSPSVSDPPSPTPTVSSSPVVSPSPSSSPNSTPLAISPDSSSVASSSADESTQSINPTPLPSASVSFNATSSASISSSDLQIDQVELNKTYVDPFDSNVTVNFVKLPGLSGNLTIKQISTQDLSGINPETKTAYDISSDMTNGTFEYTLTLPTPTTQNVEVKTSEDGKNFVTVGGVVPTGNTLTIIGLNHFSIFVVTTDNPPLSGSACINTGADSGTNCYNSIQDAINAANSGDTIKVAAGNYEGFSVDGKSNLTIDGAGVGNTVIKPGTLIDAHKGHKYTSDMQVSVYVNNSTGITLENMSVRDNGQAPGEGGPDALVFWNASSGSIKDSEVKGTYAINGIQTGQGIAVDSGSGESSDLTINGSSISGFQKNGIDAVDGNSSGSNPGNISIDVEGTIITGVGSTSAIAQNGVLVWDLGGGAVSAKVNGSQISNFAYSPGGDYATGILAYGNATIGSVSNTKFSNADYYMAMAPGGSSIDATTGNTFDTVSPSNATVDQLGAIQDKLIDKLSSGSDDSIQSIFILPNTLIVTPNGRGIQTAINNSSSGGTVDVAPGTYNESPTISQPLTLNGAQRGIDARGRSGNESVINGSINTQSSTATIDGFTINGPDNGSGVLMQGNYSGETVTNNIINNHGYAINFNTPNTTISQNMVVNGADSISGLEANSNPGNDLKFTNNSFSGNALSTADITVIGNNNPKTSDITVSGNKDTSGSTLIALFNTDSSTVSGNFVNGTLTNSAIYIGGNNSNVIVTNNTISGASTALNVANDFGDGSNSSITTHDNTFGNNGLDLKVGVIAYTGNVDATQNYWGTALLSAVQNKISGQANFQPYFVDSELSILSSTLPSQVFIDPSFSDGSSAGHIFGYDAFNKIQDGLDGVSSGGIVNVSAGTYNESPNIAKPVTLQSESGANSTIINLASGPTYLGSLTIASDNVNVNGFTVSGFDAVGSGLASSNIYLTAGVSNVNIENNLIKVGQIGPGNNGDDGIGLLTTYTTTNVGDNLSVNGNTFEPVDSLGGLRAYFINTGFNDFTFTNNKIEGNFTDGSFTQAENGLVENNTVTGDGSVGSRSAGLGTWGYPDPTLWGHTLFSGNTISGVEKGISIFETNAVTVENNDLSGNGDGVWIGDTGSNIPFDLSTIKILDNIMSGEDNFGVENTESSPINTTETLDPAHPTTTIGNGTTNITVNVPEDVTNPILDLSNLLTPPLNDIVNATLGGSVTVDDSTTLGNITVNIPKNTVVTGNASWTGLVNAPTVISSPETLPDGSTLNSAIEIGFGDVALTLSHAVRILIPGQAGLNVGYARGGVFTSINSICGSDDQTAEDAALPAGGDCEMSGGSANSDLIIWTKHFTQFITYSPANNYSLGGNGGGSSAPVCSDSAPGSIPILLSANAAGQNQVKLNWSKAQNPVSGYIVTYGLSSGVQQYGTTVGGGDSTSLLVQGLSGGATYYFRVRAANGCNGSSYSNEVAASVSGTALGGPAAGFSSNVLGASTNSGNGTISQGNGESGQVEGESTQSANIKNDNTFPSSSPVSSNLGSNDTQLAAGLLVIILLAGGIYYFLFRRV